MPPQAEVDDRAQAFGSVSARKVLFGTTIFISAFLLFQVQLLMGKFLLPWFGGSAAVWTSCMLFYQLVLLAGYAYAHWLASRLQPRIQGWIHLALLVLVALAMALAFARWGTAILPSADWKPQPNDQPVVAILRLLAVSIGLPLLVLSATSPLLQKWTSAHPATATERGPYTLYALSNLGSLLGLLSYPTLFEPLLRLRTMALAWTAGLAGYLLLCAVCAFHAMRSTRAQEAVEAQPESGAKPLGLWFALSTCGSALLLATTNWLTQDLAPFALLWVLPLAVYLLSFMLVFQSANFYRRRIYHPLLAVSMVVVVWLVFHPNTLPVVAQVICFLLLLFAGCMCCHGELVRRRPEVSGLTAFYLTVAAAGAAGGIFVGAIAPLVFPSLWEFPLALVATALFTLLALRGDKGSWLFAGAWRLEMSLAAVALLAGLLGWQSLRSQGDVLLRQRNFYGTMSVEQGTLYGNDNSRFVLLRHGRIVHGLEFRHPALVMVPTTYYNPEAGGGLALLTHPRRACGMRVGVLGLGIGTMAAYAGPQDHYRFYEINPQVIRLAAGENGWFQFLSRSPAAMEIVPGDARLSLEREPAQQFDVLVLDVFNGDSVPLHLLTRESMQLYLSHLRDRESVIAVHISNLSLDLKPVVAGLAREFGLDARVVNWNQEVRGSLKSEWVILRRPGAEAKEMAALGRPLGEVTQGQRPILWTDDHSNVFRLLKH